MASRQHRPAECHHNTNTAPAPATRRSNAAAAAAAAAGVRDAQQWSLQALAAASAAAAYSKAIVSPSVGQLCNSAAAVSLISSLHGAMSSSARNVDDLSPAQHAK